MFKEPGLPVFVALVSVLAMQKCHAVPVSNQQSTKVDQTIKELESVFKDKIENFFTKQQHIGDKLIKEGETGGYALKRISNIYAIIESFTYAIRRRSLEVAKEIIASPDGLEAAKQMANDDDFSELLEERAIMRGLVDCFQFTVFPWKLMYKYVTHYVSEAEEVAEPLKTLTGSIFREMRAFDQLGDLSFKRFGEKLEQKSITDESELKLKLDLLDKLIDKVLDCPQCSGLVEHDRAFYNVYPIFATEEDVVKAVEQYVDPDLLTSVLESNDSVQDHLLALDPGAEAVDFEEVEALRDSLAPEGSSA